METKANLEQRIRELEIGNADLQRRLHDAVDILTPVEESEDGVYEHDYDDTESEAA